MLRAARRGDREAWAAWRDGLGEGTTEKRCLITVQVPDVWLAEVVEDVPVSALAGPVQARAYEQHTLRYLCQTRRVERVHDLAPPEGAACVHLHFDRRRRLRLSAMPLPEGSGEGFVCTVGSHDVGMLAEWLRARGGGDGSRWPPDTAPAGA